MTRVLGVDGCRQGWVAVALVDSRFAAARLVGGFAELVDDPAAVIGVDIPLGAASIRRAADDSARELLGPRRSSVFQPPPRDLLDVSDYASANAASRARHGFGIMRQAWNLKPKMLDAEPHWHASVDRIFEVHPELAFAAIGGAPRPHAKKTWSGTKDRTALLHGVGIELPDDLGAAGIAGIDDVLDAAAVAWSAARIAAGTACSVPTPPERGSAGRPVAIWW